MNWKELLFKKQKLTKKQEKVLKILIISLSIITIVLILWTYHTLQASKAYLQGMCRAGGNEYMCNKMNLNMTDEGYCILIQKGNYSTRIECSWINLIAFTSYEKPRWFEKGLLLTLGCKIK